LTSGSKLSPASRSEACEVGRLCLRGGDDDYSTRMSSSDQPGRVILWAAANFPARSGSYESKERHIQALGFIRLPAAILLLHRPRPSMRLGARYKLHARSCQAPRSESGSNQVLRPKC